MAGIRTSMLIMPQEMKKAIIQKYDTICPPYSLVSWLSQCCQFSDFVSLDLEFLKFPSDKICP